MCASRSTSRANEKELDSKNNEISCLLKDLKDKDVLFRVNIRDHHFKSIPV